GKELIIEHHFPVRWTVCAAPNVSNAHVERHPQICEGRFERRDHTRVVRSERQRSGSNLSRWVEFREAIIRPQRHLPVAFPFHVTVPSRLVPRAPARGSSLS